MRKENIVYAILNLLNGKYYIGSSIVGYRRIQHHLRSLELGRHKNKHLQSSWNKYGGDSFFHFILERYGDHVTHSELLDYEQKWVDRFNSVKEGYNIDFPVKQILPSPKKSAHMKNSKPLQDHLKRLHSNKEYVANRHARLMKMNTDPERQKQNREHLARINSDPIIRERLRKYTTSEKHRQMLIDLGKEPRIKAIRRENIKKAHAKNEEPAIKEAVRNRMQLMMRAPERRLAASIRMTEMNRRLNPTRQLKRQREDKQCLNS